MVENAIPIKEFESEVLNPAAWVREMTLVWSAVSPATVTVSK